MQYLLKNINLTLYCWGTFLVLIIVSPSNKMNSFAGLSTNKSLNFGQRWIQLPILNVMLNERELIGEDNF